MSVFKRLALAMIAITAFGSPSFGKTAKPAASAPPAWMKYATPGEGHRILDSLVGRWKFIARWWEKPGDVGEESRGTSVNRLIMGGRFLKQEAKGKAMNLPFEGMGITGYDNLRQEYQSVWFDNMGTALMQARGKYDPETKTLSEEGTSSDIITEEKEKWFRAEWKWIDKEHYSYELFAKGQDGKEFKTMEITYTRTK